MPKSTKKKRLSKVVVFGEQFNIEWHDELDGLYGDIDFDKMLIRCTKGKQEQQTLMHECFHAVLKVSGHSEWLGKDREESIVSALEQGLKNVLYIKGFS